MMQIAPESMRHRYKLLAFLALACLSVAAFANTLGNDFVYDDVRLIQENENLRGFESVKLAFTADYYTSSLDMERLGYYRPLAVLVNIVDYRLWGLQPFGYHMTNLLLHIACTFLVFRLALLLATTRAAWIGALSAGFFAVHPIHTESVAFISGRVDLLCTMFYLLSLSFYVGNARETDKRHTAAGLIGSLFFLLALLSKEMAVSLPAVAFVLFVYLGATKARMSFVRALRSAFLKSLWPGATLALYLGLRLLVLGRITSLAGPGDPDSALVVLVRMLTSYGFNFQWLLAPPTYLNLEPRMLLPIGSAARIGGALVVRLAGLAVACLLWKRSRLVSVAILWVYITLLPVSGLIRVENLLAERFLYLPSVGYCLGLGIVFAFLLQQRKGVPGGRRAVFWKAAGALAVVCLLAFFLTSSIRKNRFWKDDKTLWEAKILLNPDSAKAFYNLGAYYHKRNELDGAEKRYMQAITRDRKHYKALNNLGLLYASRRQFDSAESIFTRATAVEPKKALAYYNLGNLFLERRQLLKAVAAFRGAVDANPAHYQARVNLAITLVFLGHPQQAIEQFEAILLNRPNEPRAVNGLIRAKQALAEQSGT